MAASLVLVLGVLLCSGAVLTAKGQDVREDIHWRLLQLAEDIDENVEDLGDEVEDVGDEIRGLDDSIDDIGDEIEDMEDEIEDFGEGIEDMKIDVEGVAAELVNLREEVKTVRSVFETGQQNIGQRMAQLGEECSADSNCSRGLQKDIKEGLASMETAVEGLRGELEDNVDSLKRELQENHLVVKEELAEVGTSLEGELHEILTNNTKNFLEVKEELVSLQRDMNSTLYILQELKEQLINMRQETSIAHQNIPTGSCSELHPSSQSGYYWLSEAQERVYCDMDRQSCGCGNLWGWMRVANIDMTDPNQQCPEGFRLRPEISKRMCEMTRKIAGCTSIVFPTHSVQYNRVCGRVKAYQYGTVDAFHSGTIDATYLEGVSISHGQSPRKHIWTFVAARDETRSDYRVCPCTKTTTPYTGVIPSFVGNDYFCDTGSRENARYRLYIEDPLWDGEGCGPTSSCCQFNSPPWFCKELPQPTTDDIEVRVCRDQERWNERTPFELIELYIQ